MNDETPVVLPFSLIREKFKDTNAYKYLYGIPNPMAMHKKEKSKKNRKKERGVKHGRRKK